VTFAELWLPVPGYEGSYEVSDLAHVRSLDRVLVDVTGRVRRLSGQTLKPASHSNGYLAVALGGPGPRRSWFVHQLVAAAFLGEPPPGMECCHGSAGQSDHRPENLRWGSRSANMLDKQRDGTDWQRNKSTCPLDHALVEPNLKVSKWLNDGLRYCLACHRASSNKSSAIRRGVPFNLRAVADEHYRKIMGDHA
jgi:NUMOD4 motif/HNH endonuclease